MAARDDILTAICFGPRAMASTKTRRRSVVDEMVSFAEQVHDQWGEVAIDRARKHRRNKTAFTPDKPAAGKGTPKAPPPAGAATGPKDTLVGNSDKDAHKMNEKCLQICPCLGG